MVGEEQVAGVMVGEESARKSAPSEEVVGALAAGGGGGLEDVEEGADGEEECRDRFSNKNIY